MSAGEKCAGFDSSALLRDSGGWHSLTFSATYMWFPWVGTCAK